MKRLLIIFFLCIASNSYISQAQNLEDIFDKKVMDIDAIVEMLESDGWGEPPAGYQISSQAKCLYLMILYALEYDKHVERIHAATDCEEKYDLYGVLLIYIASSTAISYCPEDLLNLFDNPKRKKEIERLIEELSFISLVGSYYIHTKQHEDFYDYSDWDRLSLEIYQKIALFFNKGGWGVLKWDPYNERYEDYDGTEEQYLEAAIKKLINDYFHPDTIIKTTLVIGEKMDALPCSPGSKHRAN